MDHPKKIIFTCNTSWGIYKFRMNLIRQLIKKGYTIYVLAPEDRYTEFLINEQGLIFIPLKHLRAVSFSVLRDWQLYLELRRHYQSIHPWLVFHYTIKANIYGTLAASKANCPSISVITGLGYTFLNDTWVMQVVTRMYRFALKQASEVWFLNNDDRDYFVHNRIVAQNKTSVLPGEGIDTNAFHCEAPYQIRPTLIFLLIGRIIKEKGISEYVTAARILKQKGYAVECQLAGFYDYKNPSSISHKKFFNWVSNGLISYLGSTDDVKPLIEKADCIVLPSYREGLPMSLLEGASMCRPLIAADTAGCRDVVVHGVNGFLCPEKDGEGLALAMEEFYHLSPAERLHMGREARKLALGYFSQEKIHGIYFEKINSLAVKRPMASAFGLGDKNQPLMHILLFVLYAALLSLMVTRLAFFSKSGIGRQTLVILFLLYGIVGCAHVMIAAKYFPNQGDIWQMFRLSVNLKQQLLHDYPAFKKEFFPDAFYVDLTGTHIGWSYYEQQGLTALHILLDFFSFDDLYINTLLFCFLTMFGKVALYRMLAERYASDRMVPLVLVFLIPSVIFWAAVIHKEGVLFSSLGVFFYCLQKILTGRGTLKRWVLAAVMFLVILITRKAVMVALLPGLAIWWVGEKTSFSKVSIVAAVLMMYAVGLALAGAVAPSWNLLHQLSSRQHEFMQLRGGSVLYLPELGERAENFLRVLPYALLNGFFMPLPGTAGNSIYLLFFLETLLVWGIVCRALAGRTITADGFTSAMLVVAMLGLLIIGYTVPFAGAIVRYRCIYYPLLLVMFLVKSPARITSQET